MQCPMLASPPSAFPIACALGLVIGVAAGVALTTTAPQPTASRRLLIATRVQIALLAAESAIGRSVPRDQCEDIRGRGVRAEHEPLGLVVQGKKCKGCGSTKKAGGRTVGARRVEMCASPCAPANGAVVHRRYQRCYHHRRVGGLRSHHCCRQAVQPRSYRRHRCLLAVWTHETARRRRGGRRNRCAFST